MLRQKIIGVSGVAGSGKDTFFQLLSERLPCERYSLADELKREVSQWCRMHYQIDSVNCDRDEKEVIRPFLVAHGTAKRKRSEGRYWIERLHNKLIKDDSSKFKIITDIRYDDYDDDEVSWLKNELNGVLIHVSQYRNALNPPYNKHFLAGANPEEARNDPKIKKKSDFQIEWEFLENGQIQELTPYVDNFISWLLKDNEKGASRFDSNKENQDKGL